MKDLLICQTVADLNDEIHFSVIRSDDDKRWEMPSLAIKKDNEQVFYADNAQWITQTFYPALKRLSERTYDSDDKNILEDFISKIGGIYDQIEGVESTVKILEYAFKKKMLQSQTQPV